MTSIHATKKIPKLAPEPDVEMKSSLSPSKWKNDEKADMKLKSVFLKEDMKVEEDGEPLQSLNNNIGFNSSLLKAKDSYYWVDENEDEEQKLAPSSPNKLIA